MKIFWSWQSDNDEKSGRYFIRDVLDALAPKLSNWDGTDDAERQSDTVELDHDTKDVAGSPPIATTILAKIDRAAVFIADVTPVGITPNGKRLVNPNVMLELGYALKSIGYERIVLVLNQADGAALTDLPFDLRHWRAPVTYNLRSDATSESRGKQKKLLSEALKARITPSLKAAAESMRRLERASKPSPAFELSLVRDEKTLRASIRKQIDDLSINTLEEIKQQHPKVPAPTSAHPFAGRVLHGLGDLYDRRSRGEPTAADVERYNDSLDNYYKAYELYLEKIEEFYRQADRTIAVGLKLANVGSAPGSDIDVELEIPAGLVLVDPEKLPDPPSPPVVPQLYRSGFAYLSRPELDPISSLLGGRLGKCWTKIDANNREVRFHIDRLKQHYGVTSDGFLLQWQAIDDVVEPALSFEITASELPDKLFGDLPIALPSFED